MTRDDWVTLSIQMPYAYRNRSNENWLVAIACYYYRSFDIAIQSVIVCCFFFVFRSHYVVYSSIFWHIHRLIFAHYQRMRFCRCQSGLVMLLNSTTHQCEFRYIQYIEKMWIKLWSLFSLILRNCFNKILPILLWISLAFHLTLKKKLVDVQWIRYRDLLY